MSDFNSKDMDALFRDGAEKHEFEYNPDAWALMEEKLDAKTKRRRFFIYLFGLLLLIVAISSYIILDTKVEKDQTEMATNAVTIPSRFNEIQNRTHKKETENITAKPREAKDQNDQTELAKEYISTDSKESSGNIGAQNSFQSENTGNLMGHEIVSIDSPFAKTKVSKSIQKETVLGDISESTNNEEVESVTFLVKERIEVAQLNIRSLRPIALKIYDLDGLDLQIAPFKSVIPTPQISDRWTFTVFANPEWSSVGMLKESKAGWSIGTKFGYQFADKYEVSAGIAYSRKIYKGGGEAYTMAGGWYDDIEPMQMDAKCDVIEIPIGISYFINGFRNSGFFVELGINSYMLHSEWYGFQYDDALVRPERYKEVIEEDQNSHLVGAGRIAMGYQKILSNNTSVQVAPYIQFPLTGIGAGQVSVYSTGVQLAVKFNTQ